MFGQALLDGCYRPLCNMVTATAVKSVLLIIFETAPQEVSDLRSLLHGLDML